MIEKFGFLKKPESFWLAALARYPAAIDLTVGRKGDEESLKALIKKFHEQEILDDNSSLDMEQLTELVTVKLLHSKKRPGFMSRITRNNTLSDLQSVTGEAFKTLQELDPSGGGTVKDWTIVSKACKQLCGLHGIGVATASLILSKFYRQIPFMSDQVLHEIVTLPTLTALKYNQKEFEVLFEKMVDKCEELNKGKDLTAGMLEPNVCEEDDGHMEEGDNDSAKSTRVWSLRTMQYAVWAYHITELASIQKKRKWEDADERKQARQKLKKSRPQ